MPDLSISKVNEVFIRIQCTPDIAQELYEHFTFIVPNAKFSPAYKNKLWDGKIRLFHLRGHIVYAGLLDHIKSFANTRNYTYEIQPNVFDELNLDKEYLIKFIDSLKLPVTIRDYQLDGLYYALQKKRAVLVSPTGSGKSLLIYLLTTFYLQQHAAKKVLVVVPTIGLVHQMISDFISYGADKNTLHGILAGEDKQTQASYVISTWQSIYKLPEKWYKQFDVVIGDEAHTFKAKSLVTIMENLKDCSYRFGLTGTLDGTNVNKLVLEGLFGSVKQVTTTSALIENQTLADLQIKGITLFYPEDERRLFASKRYKYKDEIDFLIKHRQRNKLIAGLTATLQNNTLVLFNFVKHGQTLKHMIETLCPERNVFFVYGEVEGKEREQIRLFAEQNKGTIIIASYKTFSTGINIQNLHNIVFASPSKSRIRVFQSIGRGLRRNVEKTSATLYDIADDMSWKAYRNTTLTHFFDRVQMYNQEKLNYKLLTVQLKGTS